MRAAVALRVVVLAAAATSSGCGGLQTLSGDLQRLDALAGLQGEVSVDAWTGAPILVAVLAVPDVEGHPDALQDFSVLSEPGPFDFLVPPGRYRVVAFEDANRSLDYQEDERVAGHGGFAAVSLEAGRVRAGVDLQIAEVPPRPARRAVDTSAYERRRVLGRVTRLDDARRFGPETGPLGLWNPVEFIATLGLGIHFTEALDPERVPVLFVHGISGYPQEFSALIGAMDRSRFQPWVFHYPSGLSLDWMSEHLARDIGDLAREHGVDRVCVVAHSMGGVLVRLMLKDHQRWLSHVAIPRVVTIASPLGGIASAGVGTRLSPVVVPSWRNLDPAGETIPTLFDEPLPASTESVLFFAHQGDDGSDGVVPLSSQLRAEAMAEATQLWGFSASHTGVLRAPAAASRLRRVLAACADRRAALAASGPVAGRALEARPRSRKRLAGGRGILAVPVWTLLPAGPTSKRRSGRRAGRRSHRCERDVRT